MPVEGFRNHVATDGSLLGVSDMWSASGWSAVQLDHDGQCVGCTVLLDAEVEVQRTIKRDE